MPRLRTYLRKCLDLFSSRRAEDDLAEELREHLALLEMDLQARGLSA